MAAREGVEAAHDAPASIWGKALLKSPPGMAGFALRERTSRQIKHKRVTSVEVKFKRFETVLEAALLKSPAREGRKLRRRTCVKQSHLGLYGQAARLISTGKLNALLRFHILPINHLVLMVP